MVGLCPFIGEAFGLFPGFTVVLTFCFTGSLFFYCVFMVGLLCFCMVCMCADAVIGRYCYCPFVCRVYLWCVFFTLLSFLFLL